MKLLRWVVHTLEIFIWPQDYGYVSADGDPFMELQPDEQEDILLDGTDDESSLEDSEWLWEFEDAEPKEELSWRVQIEYSNGIGEEIPCYEEQLMDKPEELYFCLLEYFEPEQ